LWLPGVDHASIACQFVVQQQLAKEGLDRQSMGRDKFLERVWEWVAQCRGRITEQHKRLGVSCDWDRETFTMDEGPAKAVRSTFVNLYNKGLIYQGERITNWCPDCSTVLSDLEVDHKEIQGNLYHIKYRLAGTDNEFVIVATTRPETLLGDTGVAVNPTDPRYTDLIGKKVIVPAVHREIPVIADEVVDTSFGTGALKVTPGHDPVDFELGQRHDLPIINVMTLKATMSGYAGERYAKLDRFICRKTLIADLERDGLLVKVEPYVHSVGHCYRCSTMVEPLVTKQWFVEIAPLARPAIDAVIDERVQIIPQHFTKVYLNWMENIRDWCISRQLWWGHRIPAWYCLDCDSSRIRVFFKEPVKVTFDQETGILRIEELEGLLEDGSLIESDIKRKEDDSIDWAQSGFTEYDWQGGGSVQDMIDETGISIEEIMSNIGELPDDLRIDLGASPIVAVEQPRSCPRCGGHHLIQDPDVLDTWFSSGLWPHSTLGWPDDTEDFKYFHPTSVMETGYDILFFWVARMIMMGLENTGQIPFEKVYLHGLIRDEHGDKMSKSKGNVLDPLVMLEQYGTDALRLALIVGNTPGNDSRLGTNKLEGSRNFANKLWNTSRFILGNLEDSVSAVDQPALVEDRWIRSRLNRLIAEVTQMLDGFMLGEALSKIHDFVWAEFCDWYIELAKIRLRDSNSPSPMPVLVDTLDTILRLLHPCMPFITEEIWQRLADYLPDGENPDSIMIASYPVADELVVDVVAEREIESVIEIVRSIRNARAEAKVEPAKFIEAFIISQDSQFPIENHIAAITALARVQP
ncbi:MAG: valine--tRNA ligase, partial [Chloroflexi bacterium]|nr:valine--tRNA ligase [Chloroflexota bacterium]